jgi:cleavage and polyadenylation specificity factor subunit 5
VTTIRRGEGEVEGLRRKLNNKLSPAQGSLRHEWECGDCVAQWCRPGWGCTSWMQFTHSA